MTKQTRKSLRSVCAALLCLVVVAAMTLTLAACANNHPTPSTPETPVEATPMGEGATAFRFEVVDKEGKVTAFAIHTDNTKVGEALQELGLIEGEAGAYGLYVKKVNGITADYDVDQTYWAFYVNGKSSATGVDTTDVVAGSTYAFKVEK